MRNIKVSTPSRLCLFGEHLDYLHLGVVACAIDLRFSAEIIPREDSLIEVFIRDSRIDTLGMDNNKRTYEGMVIDPERAIVYENDRDYLRSSVSLLLRNGIALKGCTVIMDSRIPIGKGMSSSSTMTVVFIKALLEAAGSEYRNDAERIAYWAYLAEVEEFGEPGGMMDHYTSALGGLLSLDFNDGTTTPTRLDNKIKGKFLLFDSKERKNTTQVLAKAKRPALSAISKTGLDLRNPGSVPVDLSVFDLTDEERRVLMADIDNYRILKEGIKLLQKEKVDDKRLGELIYDHHKNLRDGLGISTENIEKVLDTAMQNNALGGKINGSGGGGCCFVYAYDKDCERIKMAVEELGFPGAVLSIDSGVRVDEND